MKKNTLLKTIAIIFLVYAVLTWIIPTGHFSSGEYVKDAITPIGLFDIVRYPLITLTSSVFLLTSLVILLIGALYGVLNKTGVYQNFVESIVKKYKNKKTTFLMITVFTFVILSSLTALNLPLFIMVPFFATILLLLGYSKFTTMLATVGSILIGNIVSTYGFNVAGYVTYFTNDINNSIIYRIILFVLVVGLFIFTILKSSKLKEKAKTEEIMLYEKSENKTKKSVVPMIIILSLMMVISIVGMINWEELFGITLFGDIYTNVTGFKILGYPLFGNLIGAMYQMGSWTNYELALMLVIAIMLIAFVYKIKAKDMLSSSIEGAKKLLPVAIYAILANVIFLVMNATSTGYTIFPTIANGLFGLVDGFNVIVFGIISFIGSILFNDFPYLLGAVYDPMTNLYSDSVSIMGVIAQSIHGLIQFLIPTSVLLVIGLKYFEIPYTEWLKKVYKFALLVLVAATLVVTLMALI